MSALPDPSLAAFENWAESYSLKTEPNYSAETEVDCLAAWQASRKQALEDAAKVCTSVISSKDGERIPSDANGAYECHDKIKELLK